MQPAFVAAVLSSLICVFAFDVGKRSLCNGLRFMTTPTRGWAKVLCHMCLITQSTSWGAALTYFPSQRCRPLVIKQALLKRKQKVITTPWCLNVQRSLKENIVKGEKKHFDHSKKKPKTFAFALCYFFSSLFIWWYVDSTLPYRKWPNEPACHLLGSS